MKNKYFNAPEFFSEGMMLGTGRLGLTVMGEKKLEILALNHESLSSGIYKDREQKRVSFETVNEMREKIRNGDRCEATIFTADAISNSGIGWAPHRIDPFKSAGKLLLIPKNSSSDDYERVLSTDDATVTVRHSGFKFTYVADCVSDKLIVRIEGNGILEAKIDFFRDERLRYKRFYESSKDRTTISCFSEYSIGVHFETRVDVFGAVATQSEDGAILTIDGEALLVIDIEVSDSPEKNRQALDKRRLVPKKYNEQIKPHLERWGKMRDSAFKIVENGASEAPDETRVEQVSGWAKNGLSPSALRILADFDIHMCMASCINAKEALNLQGRWLVDAEPAWDCDYHYDANVEACYWPFDKAGLSECMTTLVEHMDGGLESAKECAKRVFGARGALYSFTDDVWKKNTFEAHLYDMWMCAGPWLTSRLYKSYEYTGDRKYLEERAYPLIKEICLFFEDFLYEDENGFLQISPSQSPENYYKEARSPRTNAYTSVCESSSFDLIIVRDMFNYAISSAKELGIDEDKIEIWQNILNKLQPLRISEKTGRILEWDKDFEEAWPDHFHFSPVVGIYPSGSINAIDTPEYYEASVKMFRHRLDMGTLTHTDWPLSTNWASCIHSVLGESEEALRCIERIVTRCTCSSLNTFLVNHVYGHVFQFEGTTTRLNAIINLFATSLAGRVSITRRLPERLGGIAYENLYLKGGFVASAEYDNSGELKNVKIKSKLGHDLKLVGKWSCDEAEFEYDGKVTHIKTECGKVYTLK